MNYSNSIFIKSQNEVLEHRVLVELFRYGLRQNPDNTRCRFALCRLYEELSMEDETPCHQDFIRKYNHFPINALSRRMWFGGSLSGKTLAVIDAWGFGDSIQDVRYVPCIKDRYNGTVLLVCRPELSALYECVASIDQLVEYRSDSVESLEQHPFDVYTTTSNLTSVMNISLLEAARQLPYLSVPQADVALWSKTFGEGTRVGIAWACGSDYMAQRSCHAIDLAPLASIPHAKLFSLQKGRREAEWVDIPGVVPLGHKFLSFYDTASAIMALDLVISVDTATAHLAGALGKPVWTLLPFIASERWGDQPDRTALYPTMRLYRQESPDDWGSVIERVRQDLQGSIGAGRSCPLH